MSKAIREAEKRARERVAAEVKPTPPELKWEERTLSITSMNEEDAKQLDSLLTSVKFNLAEILWTHISARTVIVHYREKRLRR